jgi:predicted hydrocarbon binding protein
MADESVTVKGSPVRSLQKFIESDLTAGQRETLFKNLPADFATRFRAPILATETIPVAMLNRLTEAAANAKGESLESFGRRAGREAASDAIKGIYRFFALVMTPAAILGKASSMWSSLYNRGELRVEEQEENGARIRLVNFPSEPAGCARFSGWLERMAELTGVKNIEATKTQCVTRGDECCEWRLRWK